MSYARIKYRLSMSEQICYHGHWTKKFSTGRGILLLSKKTLLIVLTALISLLVIGCTAGENDTKDAGGTDGLAAIVNDTGISMEEFENTVDRTKVFYEQQGIDFEGEEGMKILEEIRQQVIDSLVQQEVLLQSAIDKGYDISEEQVIEEIELIKEQYPTEDDYRTALEENQMTEEELKDMVASEMQISQFIENEIPEAVITEEEIQQMYDLYKMQYEAQMEENSEEDAEEERPFPSLEEAKSQIEGQLIQQKEQMQFEQMIEELMGNSDIEILI